MSRTATDPAENYDIYQTFLWEDMYNLELYSGILKIMSFFFQTDVQDLA